MKYLLSNLQNILQIRTEAGKHELRERGCDDRGHLSNNRGGFRQDQGDKPEISQPPTALSHSVQVLNASLAEWTSGRLWYFAYDAIALPVPKKIFKHCGISYGCGSH